MTTKPLTQKQLKEVAIQGSKDSLTKKLKTGSTVYTNVLNVSSSGMSRKMRVYFVDDSGNLENITSDVAQVLGYTLRDYSMTVRGCGMDMGFSVVYNLSKCLFDDGYTLKQQWL